MMEHVNGHSNVSSKTGLEHYYDSKIEELQLLVSTKTQNLRRLEAQRNDLNAKVRKLREELALLQESSSHVGEVIRPLSKDKVLVKIHPEGKYVVNIDKNIDTAMLTPNVRVALKNDSYVLHKILPNKVDPLVSLMMVEKVNYNIYSCTVKTVFPKHFSPGPPIAFCKTFIPKPLSKF